MDYNKMKKEELIKALKEKDAAIAGLQEANHQLGKDNDDLVVKIDGFTRDCEGMTEECNNFRNKINGLSNDLKKSNEICENLNKEKDVLRIEKNKIKENLVTSETKLVTVKRQRAILTIIAIIAIIATIIF